MNRIIYNKKLKKILWSLLLFIIVSNLIFPNVGLALAPFAQPKVIGSIKEVVDSMTTSGNASITTIYDKISGAANKVEDLKKEVMSAIDVKFPDLEDGMSEKAYNYYQNDKSAIEVTCNIGGSSVNRNLYIRIYSCFRRRDNTNKNRNRYRR